MLDSGLKRAGGRIVLVSSLDPDHPGEGAIDGRLDSFWISTGMYPQEIILELSQPMLISGVQLSCTRVRRIRVEASHDLGPSGFRTLAEGVFRDHGSQLQTEHLSCCAKDGQLAGGGCRYLRVLILSGWDDFCTVHHVGLDTAGAEPRELSDVPPSSACPSFVGGGMGSREFPSVLAKRFAASDEDDDDGSAIGDLWDQPHLWLGHGQQEKASEELALDYAASSSGSPQLSLALQPAQQQGSHLQMQWLEEVRRDGMALRFAPDFCDDRAVALAAVQHSGDALQFASAMLRDDREIVIAAVTRKGCALRWAQDSLRGDEEVARIAVQQSGNALQFCSPELRADKEMVLAAVGQHGSALRWAVRDLRASPEVMDVASRTFFFTREELATMQQRDDGICHPSLESPGVHIEPLDDDDSDHG